MSAENNGHVSITEQVKNVRRVLLGDRCKEHTYLGEIGRRSGKLPNDTTMKSYAYWYDPDELMRVRLGRRRG